VSDTRTHTGNARWRFVGEAIEVEYEKQSGLWWPLALQWRGRRYPITRVVSHWEDHTWRHVPPSQRRWYNQRHRNYFLVQTEDGSIFEIYMRRNALKKPWTLARALLADDQQAQEAQRGQHDSR